MAAATDFEGVAMHFSNLLHHLYRLSELAKSKCGGAGLFYAQLYRQRGGDVAAATLWTRAFDAHDVVRVADPKDVMTDVMTELLGTLVWKQRSQLPTPDPKH